LYLHEEKISSLYNLFDTNKRKILGTRPYYVLDTLVALPKHERRGAGSMLVRRGCERADAAGVVAYLEGSPVGEPLYARHCFKRVGGLELELGLRRWGDTEVMRLIVGASTHTRADMD
jgi:predicted N-acetyltransferase YhbS